MKSKLFPIFTLLLCISELSAQNQNISNGNVFEGEPYLAINPLNSQNIVVAWMGYVFNSGSGLTIKVKSSFNGGQTWNNAVKMPHIISTYKSADPSMAFDGNGNLFLSYVDYRENPDSGGVYLFKSVDGGLAWSSPIQILNAYADGGKLPIDRPWLVINNAGDKLYLTTKPAPWIPAPNRPYFTTSIDSGATWQPWRYIDTTGYLVGNLIAAPMAAPSCLGNKFCAVYPSYVASQNIYPQYIIALTNNTGSSFSYQSVFSGNNFVANDTAKVGYKFLIDPTDANHYVFIFFYSPFGDIDIMLTESLNAGITWTNPVRVNDDTQGNGKMQDLAWADFDTDGDLIITWRDRRNATGIGYTTAFEFFAAFRKKDSLNFAPNFPISDSSVSYNSILAQNGNDFMSVALRNDTLSAVWGSTADGSLDIWFVRILATTGSVTGIALLESESPLLTIYPNPSSGIFNIKVNNGSFINDIQVFNLEGEIIASLKSNTDKIALDISNQPTGIYTFTIHSDGKMLTQKIIK